MGRSSFWYVDDARRVRWAVRVSAAAGGAGARIVFTSRDQQISTAFLLEKEERELSRYELLELLSFAKADAVGAHALDRQVA